MNHEPIERIVIKERESLARDFALIGEAIADAFRSLTSPSRPESRWSQLRSCGCTGF